MPNWCNTEYIFKGEAKNLEACAAVINKFALGGYPYEDWKYGTYQLIDREIGGNLNNQDARNDFQQAEIETGSDGNTYLQTWATTAWKPEHELADKLCKKFNLTYLFYAEEPGGYIYETNDRAGIYFPDRYIVEQNNEETCYYTELQETLNDIAERTGKACEYWENAQKIVEDFNREHKDNRITLIKIEVL